MSGHAVPSPARAGFQVELNPWLEPMYLAKSLGNFVEG